MVGFPKNIDFLNSLPQYGSNSWDENRGIEQMNTNKANLAFTITVLTSLMPDIGNATALRNKSKNTPLHFGIPRLRSMISVMLILILSMTVLVSVVPFEAQAGLNAYNLKWYAADPKLNNAPYLPTYARLTPASLPSPGLAGRYADPLANAVAYGPTSSDLDTVTSLAPHDIALGQIVPFEMVIEVGGSTSPENGKIEFTTSFDTNTTPGDDFGYDPAYMVYAAFVDTADVRTIDQGNNAKVDSYTSKLIGSGNSQQIEGTFSISGLDDGDRAVVEIWVVLKSRLPASPSGNVQTKLESSKTASGDAINVGAQIVPLLRVEEFASNIADISVVKTDIPDPVITGQNLTYDLVVTNNNPDTIANGVVVTDKLDTNTSFVSAIGAPYTVSGNNVTFDVGALNPLQSMKITIVALISNTAPTSTDPSTDSENGTAGPRPTVFDLCNDVSLTAITGDSNITNNTYYQPTNVLPVLPNPVYIIDKKIIDVAGRGPEGNITAAGDVITYEVDVNNTGNVNLTNVNVNDSLINLIGPFESLNSNGILEVRETWVYTGNYTVTQAEINSNGGGNKLITNTATVDCDELDPKSDYVEVPLTGIPVYIIDKTVIDVAGRGSSANVTKAGDVITYNIQVRNVGNTDLTNVSVTDTRIHLTGPSGDNSSPGILNIGETWNYTGNYTVTQEEINSNAGGTKVISNTATVDCDELGPKSDYVEVPLKGIPAYVIRKTFTDVAGKGPAGNVTKAGDVITYNIQVRNVGNTDLTNVSVTDTLINLTGPTESLIADGILKVLETWTYTGNYTVTQEDIDSNGGGDQLIENTATVDCNELDPKSNTIEAPIGIPAYVIDKVVLDVAGRGPLGHVSKAGDLITYQIQVSNVGNVELTNISVADPLINLIGPAESVNADKILQTSEIWTYSGNYTVTKEDISSNGGGDGLIDNTVTVDCDELNPKSHTAEVPIEIPAYIIDKIITDVSGKGPSGNVTKAGDVISYQIRVSNAGNIALTNASVTDSLIPLKDPVESLNHDGVLEVLETWTYIGNYTVTPLDMSSNGGGDGLIDNTATVDCDELDPKSKTAAASMIMPAYTIDKTITDVAGKGPSANVTKAGDLISYQIKISNVGNIDISNVVVTDSLINLTGKTGDNAPLEILNVGENWIYTGTYAATQADLNSKGGGDGFINNTATVDSDQLDPKSDSEAAPIIQGPDYTIDKIVTDVAGHGASANITSAGNIISYQINVNNTGNIDLTNVNVTDPLLGNITGPAGDNSPSGILNVGENWTFTGTYTVSQEDLNSNGGEDGFINNTATVDSDELDPKNDSEAVPITQNPALLIDKSASPTNYSASGDLITYTYNVTNSGNVNITGPITVTDDKIGTVQITAGNLLPSQSVLGNATYTITQADLDAGSVTNAAYATGTFGNNTTTSNTDNETVTAVQNPALLIDKSASPTNYSASGDLITYTYNVTNSGNVNITGPITVTDDKIGTVNITSGNLIPSQSVLGNATYTITQADLDAGSVTNAAYATGTFGNNTTTSNTDNETVTAVQNPALLIDKSASPTNYSAAGDLITYTYNVTNSGNVNITGPITVTDDKIGTVQITAGNLLPSQSVLGNATYTITQADLDAGSVTNAAYATGTFGNNTTTSNTDNETVTAVQNPALLIDKSASPTNYSAAGDLITYTYNVTNSGNVNITGPITVTDDKVGTVNITSGNLVPSQSVLGNATYTITQADLDAGSVTNAAYATGTFGNNTTTSNTDNETVTAVQNPALLIDKSASPTNYSASGDLITYTYNVTNSGNVNITGPITVTDDKIGTVQITAGNLVPSQSVLGNATYTITQADLNAGSVTNAAYATGTFGNNTTTSNTDNETVTAVQNPALLIDKTVTDVSGKGPDRNVTKAGDVISYQINVSNDGNSNLTNISVTDTLINLTGPVESLNADRVLEIGEIWTYAGTYTVTQADIDSNGGGDGFINNTATVDCDQLEPKSDTVEVPMERTPDYVIDKIVTDVAGKGPLEKVTTAGDVVSYQINVTNAGNVDLINVSVTDDLIGNLTGPVESLNTDEILEVGEFWTYTGTYTTTQDDINSNGDGDGFINNTVTVSLYAIAPAYTIEKTITDVAGQIQAEKLDPKTASAEVPIKRELAYTIDKTVTDVSGKGPSGNVTKAGDVISYQINVNNKGNV